MLLEERRSAVIRRRFDFAIDRSTAGEGFQRLGDLAAITGGFPFDAAQFNRDGDGMPLIRIRDLVAGRSETYYSGPFPPSVVVEDDEIVVGMDGDFTASRWRGGRALLNQRLCVIRPGASLNADYLFFVLPIPLKVINELTPSTTVKHLSLDDIRRIRLLLPPLDEQRRVAAELKAEVGQIDALLRAIRRQASLLSEHREALIWAAVTGTAPAA
jgi:type I restriction enzyme S subunit